MDQKDTIATVNSLKNQFFYVKDFIVKKTDNGEFDVSSNVVINRCEKILRKKMELEEVDERKIKKAIKYLEAGRNGLRDKTIFLILFTLELSEEIYACLGGMKILQMIVKCLNEEKESLLYLNIYRVV